jgi:hypothetical protein
MHSTPNFEQADPRPVLGPQHDDKLTSDEQIVREELARASERLSSHGAGAESLGPSLDPEITAFRAAGVNNIRGGLSLNGPAARGIIGVLLVACIVAAAFIWQSSYGYAARLIIAEWTPALISGSSAADKSDAPPQPDNPPTVQTTATDATAPQPAASAQTATRDVASPAASAPPEQSQLLQTMAHDLADAQQKIAELKTSQEQLARDNAATAEQLKAAQQQIARLTATTKLSEQNPRPKPAAPPRRPIAAAMTAPVHQPVSTVPPPPHAIAPPMQASAQPQASAYPPAPAAQPQPQDDPTQLSSAPRPPMPVPQ